MSGFQLGVFDFWDSLRDTIEIAQRVEEFGFSRIWLAEHLVGGGPSAQIPVALVAGVASSIRVGTAGVQIHPAATFHVSATGTATQCRDRIEVLAEKLSCDEAVILARSPDLATTIRSYELLAEAFELERTPEAA